MEPAMRIHSLLHVPFEDIGSMLQDIQSQNHSLTCTRWFNGEQAPALNDFDLLIVMGGPMGVYDEQQYPWLAAEKDFIAQAIAAGKKIIGICLGAQLIASVMGARVSRNAHREIGWFPLQINSQASDHPIARILANCSEVFHWHGDTFELPANAILIASSEACAHQAYVVDDRIYGFQFHLETTEASATSLIANCSSDLDGSRYVQIAQQMLWSREKFAAINKAMSEVFTLVAK